MTIGRGRVISSAVESGLGQCLYLRDDDFHVHTLRREPLVNGDFWNDKL